jgi:hypothetical protein
LPAAAVCSTVSLSSDAAEPATRSSWPGPASEPQPNTDSKPRYETNFNVRS